MRLKILVPTRLLLDCEVDKVVAESEHGSFCLKPRHVDYVAPIVPGILSFTRDGKEEFVGVGEGVLVKVGPEVLVTVREAITGVELGRLRHAVMEQVRDRSRRDLASRQTMGKVEAALVQGLIELEERHSA